MYYIIEGVPPVFRSLVTIVFGILSQQNDNGAMMSEAGKVKKMIHAVMQANPSGDTFYSRNYASLRRWVAIIT